MRLALASWIDKSNTTYIFDSRFSEDDLEILRSCLGLTLVSVYSSRMQILLNETPCFTISGECAMCFNHTQGSIKNVILEGFQDEVNYLVGDQSGLALKTFVTPKASLRKRLRFPVHELDSRFVSKINYPFNSPLEKVEIWGIHQKVSSSDFENDEEHFARILLLGYRDLPKIECHSVYALAFLHTNEGRSIVVTDTFGCKVYVNVIGSIKDFLADKFGKLELFQTIQ